MPKVLDFPPLWEQRRTHSVFDDFYWFVTAHGWVALAADAGSSVAASDAAGGILVLTTGNTDENECSVSTATEPFLFATGKPLAFETRIQYTEASTDQAAIAVGFANTGGAANTLVDATGAVAANLDSALIIKSPGETVWRGFSSNGASRTSTASTKTAGGSSYQTLRVECLQVGLNVEVTFFVDDVQLVDSNNVPIKQTVLVASSTEMKAFVYVKTCAAADQVVNVDYIAAAQLR